MAGMTSQSWVVGKLPDCDVRVDSPTVSGRHCKLTLQGDSFLLEDLQSSNGTFVEDERIITPRVVRHGERVTLGRNTPLPWNAIGVSISIGRLPDNDIVLPLDTVSGHHAKLEREGEQTFLVDLGSTNGTAINDPLNKITRATNANRYCLLGHAPIAGQGTLDEIACGVVAKSNCNGVETSRLGGNDRLASQWRCGEVSTIAIAGTDRSFRPRELFGDWERR